MYIHEIVTYWKSSASVSKRITFHLTLIPYDVIVVCWMWVNLSSQGGGVGT